MQERRQYNEVCANIIKETYAYGKRGLLTLAYPQAKRHYNEAVCANIMSQVLQAVQYIHAAGYLHRDIKPANFLVDKQTRYLVDGEV